ncbi:MAG: excalibur calcium-binding domain-containing protein [Candidatus Nanopelagicales bacterium]
MLKTAVAVTAVGAALALGTIPALSLAASAQTAAPTSVTAVAPKKYANCTALNKVYKHGVAKKKGVKDKTSGVPVTTYTVNLAVYNLNYRSLDRDKDGIACEKR